MQAHRLSLIFLHNLDPVLVGLLSVLGVLDLGPMLELLLMGLTVWRLIRLRRKFIVLLGLEMDHLLAAIPLLLTLMAMLPGLLPIHSCIWIDGLILILGVEKLCPEKEILSMCPRV